MPTPFTHLETAQRLLIDENLPNSIRGALLAEGPAFLLGNIAADARVNGDLNRELTHFYAYDKGIHEHPWRVMVQQNPDLMTPKSAAQRAFVAGYVAHLSIDETWSLNMLGPHFAAREWGTRSFRFLMLHILLIHMDERDYERLHPDQGNILAASQPRQWLNFMSDNILTDWRDLISNQLPPRGRSQTLEVLGSRINKTPDELQNILKSSLQMQADLWSNIALDVLTTVEQQMYDHAREQLHIYWDESHS
ncbi:MAG: hypothetical protein R3E39_14390 [Anaerolineae bacterium]